MDAALDALSRGRIVAAATESLFALLVDTSRPDAVDRLLALKPRGAEKGMPVLLPERAAWGPLVSELPPLAERLADAFWPGCLTIALPAAREVDARLTLEHRIGVRLPGPSPAAELARRFGRPLTATSANPPGSAPATTAAAVRAAFGQRAAEGLCILVQDAPGGAPSTVVVVGRSQLRVARVGRIPCDDVIQVAGLDPARCKG